MDTLELQFPATDAHGFTEPTIEGCEVDHEHNMAAALADFMVDVVVEQGVSPERFAEMHDVPVDAVLKALDFKDTGLPLSELWRVALEVGARMEICLFARRTEDEIPVRVMRMSSPRRHH